MNKIEVIKKADRATNTPPPLSDFQLGNARVQTQNALKTIELYAKEINDADYQNFLRARWAETSAIVVPN